MSTQQAKNEQDPLAIAALNKSLSLDPKNLEAILALAASLTNESNQAHACYALKGTLRGHLCTTLPQFEFYLTPSLPSEA